MLTCLERLLRTATAVAAVALFAVSPARAAFYPGAWDPLYGVPFEGTGSIVGFNLGWRGDVTVFVPDSCVPISGPVSYGLFSPCAQSSYVQSAVVELYDNAAPGVTLGTIPVAIASMSVLSLNFNGNQLLSLTTLPSGWDRAQWIGTPPTVNPYFSLLFTDAAYSNFLRLIPGLADEIPAGYAGPLLLAHPTTDLDNLNIDSFRDLVVALGLIRQIVVSDVETYEPDFGPDGALFGAAMASPTVPEPGSLALVALALFATGWVARRRAYSAVR